jgi:hypothetical protein
MTVFYLLAQQSILSIRILAKMKDRIWVQCELVPVIFNFIAVSLEKKTNPDPKYATIVNCI